MRRTDFEKYPSELDKAIRLIAAEKGDKNDEIIIK